MTAGDQTLNAPRLLTAPAAQAYVFPLLIRHLLANVADQTDAVIISGDLRLTYRDFLRRVGQLASMLAAKGVRQGDVVAVMDWDSHRYLECYFAIPMMGAVLQTVNVRLSPAQIAFTLNQSGASCLLYHADFAPLCAGCPLSPPPSPWPATRRTITRSRSPPPRPIIPLLISTKTPSPPPFTPLAPPAIPSRCSSPTGNWCSTRWRWQPRWPASPMGKACAAPMSTCR
jgi:non-ribosomal peptide synthetase component F